jgi:hypothetical protein
VLLLVALGLAAGSVPLSPAARADYERAVEQARYEFVIGNTRPFDEAYPRSVFEKRVQREMAQERLLRRVFGMAVTAQLLSDEFDRIDKTTKRRRDLDDASRHVPEARLRLLARQ